MENARVEELSSKSKIIQQADFDEIKTYSYSLNELLDLPLKPYLPRLLFSIYSLCLSVWVLIVTGGILGASFLEFADSEIIGTIGSLACIIVAFFIGSYLGLLIAKNIWGKKYEIINARRVSSTIKVLFWVGLFFGSFFGFLGSDIISKFLNVKESPAMRLVSLCLGLLLFAPIPSVIAGTIALFVKEKSTKETIKEVFKNCLVSYYNLEFKRNHKVVFLLGK